MNKNKKISVIIPVYNRKILVSRAIDSVLKQTRTADEIIVVDDGSTDGTGETLKHYGDRIRILHEQNKGVSAARNRGIEASNGDWIALLDSDDEWLPEKLLIQETWIKNNPEYRICQTEEIWIRNGKRVNPMNKHQKMHGDIFIPSLRMCLVSPSAVMFEKSLFVETGGFDESLPVCEDYDLWLRISLNHPVGLISVPGIKKYGGHPDQLSRSVWGMDRYRVAALENLLNRNPDMPDEKRESVLKELVYKLEILHKGSLKREKSLNAWKNKLEKYNFILNNL
jgi:glycosyltransferase involved in cell wall biosynthesis